MANETWRDNAGWSVTWRDNSIHDGTRAEVGGSLLRLPAALGDWRIERELSSKGNEADLLLVTNVAGEHRVAKIYRSGVEPKTEVLERVGGTDFKHVVRLFVHGQSDGRWYELLEYVEHGSLWDLIRGEGPRLADPRIREILAEMAGAIHHLHTCDVVHRDIKPDNILVRSLRPLDLVLADFGIASVLGQASKRFTRNAHRTIAYAAPETAAGEISRSADWWSLGIILVEVLTGQHPFAQSDDLVMDDQAVMGRLIQMPVDQLVAEVGEPWRLLCLGLLRRQAKNRWGHDEIARWLRGDRTLQVVDEALPDAATRSTFFFAGQRYGTISDIAHAFGDNWADAQKAVERGHLLKWVTDDLRDNEWRQFLDDLDRDCGDLDERVFRIILKATPEAAPVFRGHSLDEDGLEQLAQEAAARGTEARSALQAIRERGILRLAADGTSIPAYHDLSKQWAALLAEYQKTRNAIVQAGGPTTPRDEPLAEMLLAVLPSGKAYVERLREQANGAISARSLECSWFRELANKGTAQSVATLLLIPRLAKEAEAEVQEQQTVRDADRRHREEDTQAPRLVEEPRAPTRFDRPSLRTMFLIGAALVVPIIGITGSGILSSSDSGSRSDQVAAVTEKARAASELQREQTRVSGLLTKVQISRAIVSDRPSGETGPVLYGKGPLAVYFEYDGNQVQRGDTAQIVLTWNGGESTCKSQQLASNQRNGWGWCKWDSVEINKYDVFIAINGHRTRQTAVEIASQEARRQADAALQAQQEAENRSRLLEESARLEEQRKQAQEMLTTGDECDQSAGNALDQNRNRSFAGVAYPILRNNAAVAIAKCRAAVAENPGTPRFRYQLARALQTLKNPEAKALLAELTRQRYPAAFDNLGWLHHNERDYRQAANYFRSGVQMNDPESMVSLAGYLLEGRFIAKDEREAMRLLTEAEKYGHPTAVRAMNEYRQQQRLKAAGIQILSSVLRQILEVR